MDVLESLLTDPLLLTLVLLGPAALLAARGRAAADPRVPWGPGRAATWSLVALYAGWAITYVLLPQISDHVGPQIAAASALLARGEPIYHAADAPVLFGITYGPLTYVIDGAALALTGGGMLAVKLPGVLAALAALALFHASTRGMAARERLGALGLFVLLLLVFPLRSVRARPDPFLLLAVVGGVATLRLERGWHAWLLLGALAGASANLKAHGPAYFLPAAALLASRHGARSAFLAFASGLLALAAPFALSQVPAGAYLDTLRNVSRQGFDPALLPEALTRTVYLGLPVLLALAACAPGERRRLLARSRWTALAFLPALGVALLASCKHGSNWQHLLPLAPYFALAPARLAGGVWAGSAPGTARRALRSAFLAAGVVVAVAPIGRLWTSRERMARVRALAAEVEAIAQAHPGETIHMGYGGNDSYADTLVRPRLVFAGHPYVLDSSALMERRRSGLELGPEVLELLARGVVDVWLIPRGSKPFTLRLITSSTSSPVDPDLFGPAFRKAFARHYEPTETTEHFELWRRRR